MKFLHSRETAAKIKYVPICTTKHSSHMHFNRKFVHLDVVIRGVMIIRANFYGKKFRAWSSMANTDQSL